MTGAVWITGRNDMLFLTPNFTFHRPRLVQQGKLCRTGNKLAGTTDRKRMWEKRNNRFGEWKKTSNKGPRLACPETASNGETMGR